MKNNTILVLGEPDVSQTAMLEKLRPEAAAFVGGAAKSFGQAVADADILFNWFGISGIGSRNISHVPAVALGAQPVGGARREFVSGVSRRLRCAYERIGCVQCWGWCRWIRHLPRCPHVTVNASPALADYPT
jgi:hypothetical protein